MLSELSVLTGGRTDNAISHDLKSGISIYEETGIYILAPPRVKKFSDRSMKV